MFGVLTAAGSVPEISSIRWSQVTCSPPTTTVTPKRANVDGLGANSEYADRRAGQAARPVVAARFRALEGPVLKT